MRPAGVSVLPNGQLLVTDGGIPYEAGVPIPMPDGDLDPLPPGTPQRVYLVDPTTGNRTVLSQNSLTTLQTPPFTYPEIGSGTPFDGLAIAKPVGNQILVTSGSLDSPGMLMRIDPATGNRCRGLKRLAIPAQGNSALVQALARRVGFAVSGNTAFVAQWFGAGVMKVDLSTGNRTLFSSLTAGSGPPLGEAVDIQPFGGQLYVSGYGSNMLGSNPSVFRIDPTTGARTVVAKQRNCREAGRWTGSVLGLAIQPGGTILLTRRPGHRRTV